MRDDFKAGSRQGHELVTDIQVVSPTEITWKMKQAYAPYFAILASTFIVPKHILGSAADPNIADFNNAPIGTGAFVWGERVPGDHITLTANPSYFGDGPYLDKLVFKYIPDLTVMFTQFKTGEIDYTGLQGITPDHLQEAKTLTDRDIHVGEQAFVEAISCNFGKPAFQEKEVREAIYLSMDKDTIIKDIYNSVHKSTESYLPTSSWAYNSSLPPHEYNPQKAMQILDAAGWKVGADGIREKNGVKLQFTNSTTAGNKVREQTQAFLQQGWKQVGIGMEIKDMPAAVVWGDYTNMSQYETIMSGTHFGIGPDPDATFYFESTMSPAKGGHGDNHMQYVNPKIDELLQQGATTIDQEKRKAIYQQIQQVLRDDLAIVPMFQYGFIEGTRKGLLGYVNNPNVVSNAWNIRTWRWQA
jgi:peptide/nickel transport system substrate-binding protein